MASDVHEPQKQSTGKNRERGGHRHGHGAVDPVVFTTERGIQAVKWSLLGLVLTAGMQMGVVALSGSVALLADTLHNFGDAATAVPLWVAFVMARKPPNTRFTYGYGRVEDLAGMIIVLIVLLSAALAVYQAIDRLYHPRHIEFLWTVMAASALGFIGNEAVASYRIKVGKEIHSAALVADGLHARVDGLTSLAVLVGAGGVALGFPAADPIVGLLIGVAILRIAWQSGREVFTRILDGVDPEVSEEIYNVLQSMQGVKDVREIRVRWLGHRLLAEINLAIRSDLSVESGHEIAKEARHQLLHHLPYLFNATIHIDPVSASGEGYHRISNHIHGDHRWHSHP